MPQFTHQNISLHYEIHGEGYPVILIHGTAVNFAFNFGQLGWIQSLNKAGFQVIGTDLRGHGKSEKPEDSTQYGTEIITSDIIALMDHIGVQKAHIIGYSIGTVITLNLIQKHPDRFDKAVLMATGDGLMGIPPYIFDQIMPRFAQLLTVEEFPAGIPKHVAVYQAFMQQTGGNRHALHAFAMAKYPAISETEAKKIRVPTLILSGEKDPVLGKAPQLAKALSHGEYAEIAGADHFSLAIDPTARSKTIDFLTN